MRISANPTDESYHDAHYFLKDVYCGAQKLMGCISFDTIAGVAACYKQPMTVSGNGDILTEEIRGNITYTLQKPEGKHSKRLQKEEIASWEAREAKRAQIQDLKPKDNHETHPNTGTHLCLEHQRQNPFGI